MQKKHLRKVCEAPAQICLHGSTLAGAFVASTSKNQQSVPTISVIAYPLR
jgi:hypothetical protein